jgi:hypothetical protein
MRTWGVWIAGPLALAACAVGCSGSHPVATQPPPVALRGSPQVLSPTSSPVPNTEGAGGIVEGFDALCAGPATVQPRTVTVRVLRGERVIASERFVARASNRASYRIRVPTGRYRVEATNWPGAQHSITVHRNGDAIADFPNVCD